MASPSSPQPAAGLPRIEWSPYGPDAVLLRFADSPGAPAFHRGRLLARELDRHPPTGLLEWVPGFTTLLLLFHPGTSPSPHLQAPAIVDRLQRLAPREETGGRLHEIPVRYDGPDLRELADARGLSVADVIRLHAAPVYRVHLLGFAPGFPYLGELDPRLHQPRRSTPRPFVRAGSLAIGGEHTGIYSVDGPGGWNLIGRTDRALFDPTRAAGGEGDEAMFLLRAGDRVRFVPVDL